MCNFTKCLLLQKLNEVYFIFVTKNFVKKSSITCKEVTCNGILSQGAPVNVAKPSMARPINKIKSFNFGKPHYDLPCKTTYPSQYVKLPTFSIYFEKVGGFTELLYVK